MAANARWQDWTSFILGVWLALSPWLLDYHGDFPATANAVACGLALALTSHFEAACCEDSAEWLNLALGLWLALAPFVLGLDAYGMAALNCLGVGVIVAALAVSTLELHKGLSRWLHESAGH